ncbi:hypothetical protein AGR9A_Cc210815 [Agrobacterium salinitolerans str. Hayward 0363]|nr:hypothetical protein AGR9A_Cc210815 [Agrobacterium salinitolerans str. Hayward 0363]
MRSAALARLFRLEIVAESLQEAAEKRDLLVIQALRGVTDEFIDFLAHGFQHLGCVFCHHYTLGAPVLRVLLAFDEIKRLQLVEIGADRHGLDAEPGGDIRLFAAINDGDRQQCACFAGCQAQSGFRNSALESTVQQACATVQ